MSPVCFVGGKNKRVHSLIMGKIMQKVQNNTYLWNLSSRVELGISRRNKNDIKLNTKREMECLQAAVVLSYLL